MGHFIIICQFSLLNLCPCLLCPICLLKKKFDPKYCLYIPKSEFSQDTLSYTHTQTQTDTHINTLNHTLQFDKCKVSLLPLKGKSQKLVLRYFRFFSWYDLIVPLHLSSPFITYSQLMFTISKRTYSDANKHYTQMNFCTAFLHR